MCIKFIYNVCIFLYICHVSCIEYISVSLPIIILVQYMFTRLWIANTGSIIGPASERRIMKSLGVHADRVRSVCHQESELVLIIGREIKKQNLFSTVPTQKGHVLHKADIALIKPGWKYVAILRVASNRIWSLSE